MSSVHFVTAAIRVFLDLKLHDIPNTVAKAVGAVRDLDVELLTVHASGGRAMLDGCPDGGRRRRPYSGVTVLDVARR